MKTKSIVFPPLLLATLCLSACSSSERSLTFFEPQGEMRQMRFALTPDGTQAQVTISAAEGGPNRTLSLQQRDGRKIMLAINHQDQPLNQHIRHDIQDLQFYELGQGGFVDAYHLQGGDLCRRFMRNQVLNVEHALSFYQQNAQGQARMFGVVSRFSFNYKEAPLKIQSSRNIPEHSQDYRELVQGSAKKIHSFLAKVVCHQH